MHTSMTARKSEPVARTHTTSILIVDDDPDFLDLLISEIGQIPGTHIDVAHGPDEALKMLKRREYQLIVSDWALDGSTASDVLSEADDWIGSEPEPVPYSSKVPVMFISGSEKVNQTQLLHSLKHFEPVSFILKRCGPPLIGLLAEHILARFHPVRGPELHSC